MALAVLSSQSAARLPLVVLAPSCAANAGQHRWRVSHAANRSRQFGAPALFACSLRGPSPSTEIHWIEQTGGGPWRSAFFAKSGLSSLRAGAGLCICAVGLDLRSVVKPFPGWRRFDLFELDVPKELDVPISCRFVAAFHRGPPDADRFRAGWRCGGPRRC